MLVKNPKFLISAVRPNQYPSTGLPEIVFAGKSNVGKSSFINAMVNRKSLARTSSEPGKTRQINFYDLDSSLYFVDLPGYGYSKMSKKEQEEVGKFIEKYLFARKEIACIALLLDIRHSPSSNDVLMYEFIQNTGLPYVVLATKADKIAVTKVDSYVQKIRLDLQIPEEICVLPFSCERKIYTESVWKEFDRILGGMES